jgi:hypothetical protein
VPITFFTAKENTSFVLKQVDSYVRIVGEPKLPSSFLQVVIFLVLSIPNYSFGMFYVDSLCPDNMLGVGGIWNSRWKTFGFLYYWEIV